MDSEFYGFEISVDEAAYLIDRIDLGGPLPEVLALYNPMTNPDLNQPWNALQIQRLTDRGILTPTGVLPEVATLLRDMARAEETLAIRITPLHIPDTMLRIAIARRDNHFVYIARTRDVVLAQPVPALDWPAAAAAVLNTQLGPAAPAPLAVPLQLTTDEVKRIAALPPGTVLDTLIDQGVGEADALILNAASRPTVATEITASCRVNGTTRRGTTAVSVLDTEHGRVIAWPHTGPDQRTWITYAEGAPHRLQTGVQMLFEQLHHE
ncbi:MAG: ESX secretion-associated protein EspG [Mycobacterium sp.]